MGRSSRYVLVVVGMCGLLASGVGLVTNVAGLFFTPVAEEFGVLKGEASLMVTVCNISFAVGGLVAPRLLRESTFRVLLVAATATLAGATAALSLAQGMPLMYALCACRGLAAGMAGFVFVTSVLNRWFVERIGLVTSIAMGCSGLAGAAFTPLVSSVIAGAGWRSGYLLLAALTIALNLPAILFLPALDPAAAGLRAFGTGAAGADGAAAGAGEAGAPKPAAEPPAAVSPVLFAAVLAFAVLASAVTALPQHFPGIAESHALAVGATMLSVCMVANTAGKVLFGVLTDRLGARTSIYLYVACVLAAIAALLLVPAPGAYVAAGAVYGLCYALATVGITMVTRDAFGLANYGRTYPTMSLGGNVANAVFSSVVGFMYDFTGGYASTLVLFAGMLVAVAGLVTLVYARRGRAV